MDIEKTGKLIKGLRSEKGLTQKELAERLSVSTAAVSKWENGKGFPDISILEELSIELGISITELVKGERTEENVGSDSVAKDLIEISKKELKFEKARRIFVISALSLTILSIISFILFDAYSGFQKNFTYSLPIPSIIGLSMFLFGGNAIVFAILGLVLGGKIDIKKSMQISIFSEACCAVSIWLGTFYTDYKVSINDISAVLDTANALELESRIILFITVWLNILAYWKIVKNK